MFVFATASSHPGTLLFCCDYNGLVTGLDVGKLIAYEGDSFIIIY